MSAASPNEREIRESLSDPTVPARGLSSFDYSKLTPEERARLVLVDPYANGRAERQAAAESIEVQLAGRDCRRVRLPCATREQRESISRRVEDGELLFIVSVPSWHVGTGRPPRLHEWPSEAEIRSHIGGPSAADRRRAEAEFARRRAESERMMNQTTTPWTSKMVYRPPTAG